MARGALGAAVLRRLARVGGVLGLGVSLAAPAAAQAMAAGSRDPGTGRAAVIWTATNVPACAPASAKDILVVCPSVRAARQPRPRPAVPARSREPTFTVQGFVHAGFLGFSSTEALTAVYDASGGFLWGGGARVGHRAGLFVQAGASRFAVDGERVFLFEGQVFNLGITSRLTVVPVDVSGGWRFRPAPRPAPPVAARVRPRGPRRWIPYVGGGAGFVRVTERAEFSEAGDDFEERHVSYHVMAGVDVPAGRWLGAGIEAGWRWVPDALAGDGIAAAFGETDLHHFVVVGRLTFGR
jgi:hypothetical protein